MTLTRYVALLQALLWAVPAFAADRVMDLFPAGAAVVVVVSRFPPTVLAPEISGYEKPLAIHPGKRATVIGWEVHQGNTLIWVQWEEQYWQEWTEPATDGYLDNNQWFMAQTGKWVKWRSFASTINPQNLLRVPSSSNRNRR